MQQPPPLHPLRTSIAEAAAKRRALFDQAAAQDINGAAELRPGDVVGAGLASLSGRLPDVSRGSELDAEINRLGDELCNLGEGLAFLRDRLGPLLRDVKPAPAEGAGPVDAMPSSAATRAIRAQTHAVLNLRSLVGDLSARLVC